MRPQWAMDKATAVQDQVIPIPLDHVEPGYEGMRLPMVTEGYDEGICSQELLKQLMWLRVCVQVWLQGGKWTVYKPTAIGIQLPRRDKSPISEMRSKWKHKFKRVDGRVVSCLVVAQRSDGVDLIPDRLRFE